MANKPESVLGASFFVAKGPPRAQMIRRDYAYLARLISGD
jgi:hypothetical protein